MRAAPRNIKGSPITAGVSPGKRVNRLFFFIGLHISSRPKFSTAASSSAPTRWPGFPGRFAPPASHRIPRPSPPDLHPLPVQFLPPRPPPQFQHPPLQIGLISANICSHCLRSGSSEKNRPSLVAAHPHVIHRAGVFNSHLARHWVGIVSAASSFVNPFTCLPGPTPFRGTDPFWLFPRHTLNCLLQLGIRDQQILNMEIRKQYGHLVRICCRRFPQISSFKSKNTLYIVCARIGI